MLSLLSALESRIGLTPVRRLDVDNINLFTKLEFCNMSGSIKDRAAISILKDAVRNKEIDAGSTIVESSSGNLAISLAHMCHTLQLPFVAVIDPNINSTYEQMLRLLSVDTRKVDKMDEKQGYLLNRIETVKAICASSDNTFWTNQYGNESNYRGYYQLAKEVKDVLPSLDYLFVAVSSGGAVTGLSCALKEYYPNIEVVAIDVEGSVIFRDEPRKRYISGIGSSLRSPIIEHARIDQVMHISNMDLIRGCHELLKEQHIFAGGSTGAIYYAIRHRFDFPKSAVKPNVLFCCADGGHAYLDNVYNKAWVDSFITETEFTATCSI